MLDYRASPLRPWKEIAAELCRELDPRRLSELSLELDAALEAQTGVNKSSSSKTAPVRPDNESSKIRSP